MNNPHAFPSHHPITQEHVYGMTLRDHFAGIALGDIASGTDMTDSDDMKDTAERCYAMADAMLAACAK